MPIKEIMSRYVTLPRHAVYVVSLITTQTMKFYTFLNELGNLGFKAWILKWLFCRRKNHDQQKNRIKTILGSFK